MAGEPGAYGIKEGVFLANVTFEPGCRNNWHIHHAKSGGQLLICTAGSGWYQEEGKEAVSLEPGMVITIPAETGSVSPVTGGNAEESEKIGSTNTQAEEKTEKITGMLS